MSRLRQYLLRSAGVGSIILLSAGTLLWITSYWRQVVFFYQSPHQKPFGRYRHFSVHLVRGNLYIQYLEDVRKQPHGNWRPGSLWLGLKPIDETWSPPRLSHLWRFMWISRYQEYPRQQGHVRELTLSIPHWAPLALFAVLPAVWVLGRVRRSRRLRSGRCASCGYDLRASGGRCPECGTPIAPPGGNAVSGTRAELTQRDEAG